MSVDPPLDDREPVAPSPTPPEDARPAPSVAQSPSPTAPVWGLDSQAPDLTWSSVKADAASSHDDQTGSDAETSYSVPSRLGGELLDPGVIARPHRRAGATAEPAPDEDAPIEQQASLTTALPLLSPRHDGDESATDQPTIKGGLGTKFNLGRRRVQPSPELSKRAGSLLELSSTYQTLDNPAPAEGSFWQTVLEAGEEHAVSLYRRQAAVAGLALIALIVLAAFSLPRAFERDPGPGVVETDPADAEEPRSPVAADDSARLPVLPESGSDLEQSTTASTAQVASRNATRSDREPTTTGAASDPEPPPDSVSETSAGATSSTVATTSTVATSSPILSTSSTAGPLRSTVPTTASVSSSISPVSEPTSTPPTTRTPTTSSSTSSTKPSTTRVPTTRPPVTTTPTTTPSTTKVPTTKPPTTAPPTTVPPSSQTSTTAKPTTTKQPTSTASTAPSVPEDGAPPVGAP